MILADIMASMGTLVLPKLNDDEAAKYLKLNRLASLYITTIAEGWESFSWQKLHDEGYLCKSDYRIFEELKDFDPNEYHRKLMERV